MSKNQDVNDVIAEASRMAEDIVNREGIVKVIDYLKAFTDEYGPIKFNHIMNWSIVVIMTIVSVVFALAHWSGNTTISSLGIYVVGVYTILCITIVIPLSFIFSDDSSINDLSDTIFNMDIVIDNGLTIVGKNWKVGSLYKKYRAQFGDFHRGDEDREITTVIKGVFNEHDSHFNYDCYTFRYVRVYYVPVTRTIGKVTTVVMERRTETLYRHGIILDFALVKGIAVTFAGEKFDYSEEWNTASSEFNEYFSVNTDDLQTAVKFLQPKVILEFLEIAKYFEDFNLEINSEGRLNISFADDLVFCLERSNSITDIHEFEQEIAEHRELKRLKKLLEFVSVLQKFNDKNF